jgi:hypothetical protein
MKAREQALEAVKAVAAARGRDLRKTVKREFAAVRDELLVEAGRAAQRRIVARERKRALVRAGTVAAVAGAGVAAVLATRAVVRKARKAK